MKTSKGDPMKKIFVIFGTRPEAIKMAPLINKLKETGIFNLKVCVTAQHREMLDSVLDLFKIKPDYDLNIMNAGQSISEITIRTLEGVERILLQEKPDIILVQGDTTTSFSASLASFYHKIPIGHVEAGLRSGNCYSPFPKEMNRRLTGTLAAWHFAPTESNRQNLLNSGICEQTIFVTGNTVIDALYLVLKENYRFPIPLLNKLDTVNKRIILLTVHRRENWGLNMRSIFCAVNEIIEKNPDIELIYPVHLNPVVKNLAYEMLGANSRVHLISPLDYEPFVNLMAISYLVMTDSGGIQEEAPALGKPVLVLRTETERPEAVEAGTVKIIGVEQNSIIKSTQKLIDDRVEYEQMARAVNPYGDGQAAAKIKKILIDLSS